MAVVPQIDLDATDARLLEALQADGRQSIAELGRRVSMSASAVAERVRRRPRAARLGTRDRLAE
jgi:Lrp/AsnC family leucine-responsive transcriptional regulator